MHAAARRAPSARSRSARPSSVSTRTSAARSASGSSGGTSSPASPTTSGRAPVAVATTGTPHAMASTATRPNCSTQPGVSRDGTARTSSAR
ncbi:hypothetical protein BJF88_10410 [Cellulosimicrobium sp. CUA-896]|nr:hypothetical protein BJF88_10410 [Cellulosimicrobium sp. CUA-896]